jgi:hypothetical protein
MTRTTIHRTEVLAAPFLIALGILIFCVNLDRAVSSLLDINSFPRQVMGLLPALLIASSRIAQACASDHHGFIRILVFHVVLSCWPLLLVFVGAVLFRESE